MQMVYFKYLEKQSLYPLLIKEEASPDLKTIVIIPCYNEPDIIQTIISISEGIPPMHDAEIIILINEQESTSEEIKQQNIQSFVELQEYKSQSNKIQVHPILIKDLPKKHAGAGLARKIAMDEAIRRFQSIKQDAGIIVSLDADSLVSNNYLIEIEKAFSNPKKVNCTIFNFKHPLNPTLYGTANTLAIAKYELYLRYYKLSLARTNFPYAFHTIGSCFAVSSEAYAKQGGMNRKQAGEDFYFLQKVFPIGKTLELKHVYVYPSSRPSNRVPFGTGPAIQKIAIENQHFTYQWSSFLILKHFFEAIPNWHNLQPEKYNYSYLQLSEEIKSFLSQEEWSRNIVEININSSDLKSFEKRFYHWFNAFKIIKFLNHLHSNIYIKEEIEKVAMDFLGLESSPKNDVFDLLEKFRKLEQ